MLEAVWMAKIFQQEFAKNLTFRNWIYFDISNLTIIEEMVSETTANCKVKYFKISGWKSSHENLIWNKTERSLNWSPIFLLIETQLMWLLVGSLVALLVGKSYTIQNRKLAIVCKLMIQLIIRLIVFGWAKR